LKYKAYPYQVVRRRRATNTTQSALSDVINQSIRRKLQYIHLTNGMFLQKLKSGLFASLPLGYEFKGVYIPADN
jgi:hypothetical protein